VNHQSLSSFIWSVADLLRGDYKQSDYGKIILPFTVLRRLDCVLEVTKPKVLTEFAAKKKEKLNPNPFLLRASRQSFYNTSPMDLGKLMGDQDHIRENLFAYVQAFSPAARDIFERLDFATQIEKLAKCSLLYQVTEKFAGIDLHPDVVSNSQMGLAFEELIRKFAELSNETAAEHFTPRDVIRLMVNLLFVEDDDVLSKPGVVRTIYDPAAGTGGMLSAATSSGVRSPSLSIELSNMSVHRWRVCRCPLRLCRGGHIARALPAPGATPSSACPMHASVPLSAASSTIRSRPRSLGSGSSRFTAHPTMSCT
jgi:type I restriction enzyme M protein